jgi:A/G-specific adenine glycosylase
MLQQTQVQTVIPYYERFMARFPTLASLAEAPEEEVIHAWAGLGYYSRARNLQRGAREVQERYGGRVPADPAALLALPGVGRYTAGAIASIAYNVPAPILDGNVIRVLARLYALRGDPKRAPLQARLWELAESLIPPGRASRFNPAMMELGATVCTPQKPACDRCPVALTCRARALGHPEVFPETPKAPPSEPVRMAAGVVWSEAGEDVAGRRLLVCRGVPTLPARPIGLAAMWQFPNGVPSPGESAPRAVRRVVREMVGLETAVGAAAGVVKHGVTRYRVTLAARHCPRHTGSPAALGCAEWAWVSPGALSGLAMPSAHRRLAEMVRRAWKDGAGGAFFLEEPQLGLTLIDDEIGEDD